ncbi:MAG: C25 family cysteine peptidase [Thermoplasmata archaeon]|nr:C25 family cysteine peptidase [Thermoplasmata archaeon]
MSTDERSLGKMKVITLSVVMILLLGGLSLVDVRAGDGSSSRKATLADLLGQEAVRSGQPEAVVASADEPYYALIGTPLALYYEGGERMAVPLLVGSGDEISSAVGSFLVKYDADVIVTLGSVDNIPFGQKVKVEGSPRDVSIEVARAYWVSSKGAVLVETSQLGYNMATAVMPLASYLNMPVMATDSTDGEVKAALRALGVEFTIVCGGIGGYGKEMRLPMTSRDSGIFTEEETSMTMIGHTRDVIEQRLGLSVGYLAVANPLDVHENEVLEAETFHFEGMVGDSSSGAYPGAAPDSPDGPISRFEIPEGWNFANLKIDAKMDVSEATGLSIYTLDILAREGKAQGDAHYSGERMYVYLGLDADEDGAIDASGGVDELYFFGGSPGYDYVYENPSDPTSRPLWAHFYTELAQVNSEGPMDIQVLARLPTVDSGEARYTIDITVERIAPMEGRYQGAMAEVPVFPLMRGLSSMAGYLTAFRGGLLLSKPQFLLHSPGYIGCSGCGEPAANPDALDEANKSAVVVKKDIIQVLGLLTGRDIDPDDYTFPDWCRASDAEIETFEPFKAEIVALAAEYQRMFYEDGLEFSIALVGDTNMVPQFYYESGQGDPTEGFGMPSDNFYSSLDADPYDAPYDLMPDNDQPYECQNAHDQDFEVGVGRVDGWDAQDVSALIARTAFYYDIIDAHDGPVNDGIILDDDWKDSVYTTLGTIPPVEVAKLDLIKFREMARAAGFTPPTDDDSGFGDDNQKSRRQYSQDKYESANFIFFCAHGFYYWYVPTAQEGAEGIADPFSKPTYGGGAYDVAHVRYMDFGPTLMFGSSCVTGRIDGLYPVNALSQAFLHAGVNGYVGATRMSWGTVVPVPDTNSDSTLGDYLALCMWGNHLGYIYDKTNDQIIANNLEDLTAGFALMDAKNKYIRDIGTDGGGPDDDTINEFILHGDPAFNPYEPNH